MTSDGYQFGRRDGASAQCCGTCGFAILHGGRGTNAVRRWCKLRQTWLPFKERERLRAFGCNGHQRDTASRESLALWERLTPTNAPTADQPDADGWIDQDFEGLR